MANFTPPFSNTADKRFPTSDERANGFPCGPADRQLFNGLIHRLESEVGAVIAQAGLVQSDASFVQLRDAISAMIAAATGGGNPANYVTLAQASARLPIWPEVLNATGLITPTAPATGTIRIPAGVNFQHRGISPYTTAQTDLVTVASKTYHVRWRPVGGFVILDLANVSYNPSALAEGNLAFDSTYDDMLVARVITNASNIATITPLANKPLLAVEATNTGAPTNLLSQNGAERTALVSWNFSRVPILSVWPSGIGTSPYNAGRTTWAGSEAHDHDYDLSVTGKNRYGASVHMMRDYATDLAFGYQAIAP